MTAVLAVAIVLVSPGQAWDAAAKRDLADARVLEARIQGVIGRVRGAVVTVGVRPGGASGRGQLKSGGSGVVISADGYVLTCDHVTEGQDRVLVGLSDGRTVTGRVVGRDVLGDVALLKVSAGELPFVELGDSEALAAGDLVVAMGNPFGLARDDHQPAATLGIVSALHRYMPGKKVYGDALQIDAAVNPGNSGGPLFDLGGKLVGLNGRISIRGLARHNVGVGFAIPAHQIALILDDLKAGREVSRGYLGVRFYTRSDGQAGVLVSQVMPQSPASRGGLRSGDRILEVRGRALAHPVRLQNYLSVLPAGTRVPLRVRRGREVLTIEVQLAARPEGTR